MNREMKMPSSSLPQGVLIRATKAVADAVLLSNQPKRKESWTANIFGKTLKRALLALAIGGAVLTFSGCFSVHVHHETDQPAPVIVVPQDHPNP
jgi:hypothetical protein